MSELSRESEDGFESSTDTALKRARAEQAVSTATENRGGAGQGERTVETPHAETPVMNCLLVYSLLVFITLW